MKIPPASLLLAVTLLTHSFSPCAAQTDPGRMLAGFASAGYFNHGIFSMNPDGSNAVFLTALGAPTTPISRPFHATMSRDGRKIAFAALVARPVAGTGNMTRIFVMNADGSGLMPLLDRSNGDAEDTFPVVSPDGTRIAFISNRGGILHLANPSRTSAFDVFVININNTGLRQVTESQFRPDFPASFTQYSSVGACVWGPDSQTIAFRGERTHGRPAPNGAQPAMRNSLHTIRADGTNDSFLEFLDGNEINNERASIRGALDWSPDGRLIVWAHDASNNANVYRFHALSGSTPASLDYADLNEGANNSTGLSAAPGTIRFSPDSGKLAFHSAEADGANISVIDVAGGNYRRFRPALPPVPVFVTGPVLTDVSLSLWWHGGPNQPAPASLTLPTKITIPAGGSFPLAPQLRDGAGNLLSRSALHFQTTPVGPVGNAALFKFGADWNTFIHDPSFASGPHDVVARHGDLTSAPMRVFAGTARFRFASRPASLTRSGTTIFADLDITNIGDGRAATIVITEAKLNGVANSRNFASVLNIAAIQPGATGGTSGSFGFVNAGAAGAPGLLVVKGTFIGGSFNTAIRLTLP